MNKKLEQIRAETIEAREELSYANPDHQKDIARLDRIIRGAVLVKLMHLFAAVSFIVFAAVFIYLVYPAAKFMMLMLGFAVGGYAITAGVKIVVT